MSGLSALGIKKAGPGKLYDGDGLELHKSDRDKGKWIWRYSFAGKRREMGLGAYPAIGLADAREARKGWAKVLSEGKDPITERRAQVAATKAEMEREDPPLDDLIQMAFEAKQATLRGDGTRGRWLSPLKTHVSPKIGRRRVSTLTKSDFHEVLRPIWKTQHPTAEKVYTRLRYAIEFGQIAGFDCDPIEVLRAQKMLGHYDHQVSHIVATPWQEIPTLYQRLEGQGFVAACLQFMILTLVRSHGCRQARFNEFEPGLWVVPGDRIKSKKNTVSDFHVPLSIEAGRLIDQQRNYSTDVVFPGHRGKPISDNALSMFLNRIDEPGRPHGFRTSFATWAQDTDACPWDVRETILGHSIGGKVERSYARSDLLDRRRPVMEAWARYVTGKAENVVAINR